jgi:hypothetical protein
LAVDRDRCRMIAQRNHAGDLIGWLRYFGHASAKREFTCIEARGQLERITWISQNGIGLVIGFDTVGATIP